MPSASEFLGLNKPTAAPKTEGETAKTPIQLKPGEPGPPAGVPYITPGGVLWDESGHMHSPTNTQVGGLPTPQAGQPKGDAGYQAALAEARSVFDPQKHFGNTMSEAALQGMTFGFAPEMQANVAAMDQAVENLIAASQGKGVKYTPEEVRRAVLQASHEAVDKFGRDHPVGEFATEFAGGMLTPTGWLNDLKMLRSLSKLQRAIIIGGGIGGVAGYGYARGTPEERLQAAVQGFNTGGALTAGLGKGNQVLAGLAGKYGPPLAKQGSTLLGQLGGQARRFSAQFDEHNPVAAQEAMGRKTALSNVRKMVAEEDPEKTLLKREGHPQETAAERLGRRGAAAVRHLLPYGTPTEKEVYPRLLSRLRETADRIRGMFADAAGLNIDTIEGQFSEEDARLRKNAKPELEKFHAREDVESEELSEVAKTDFFYDMMREAAHIASNEREDPYKLGLLIPPGDPREIVAARIAEVSGISDDLLNGNFRSAVKGLREENKEKYGLFYSHSQLDSPALVELSKDPFVHDALSAVAKIAKSEGVKVLEEGILTEEERDELIKEGKEPPQFLTALGWDYVKRGFDELLDKYRDPNPPYRLNLSGRPTAQRIVKVREAVLEALTDPETRWGDDAAAAFKAGGDPIRMSEAFDAAADMMAKNTNDERFNNYWNKLADPDKDAMRAGVVALYRDAARRQGGRVEDLLTPLSQDKLRTIFGNDQANLMLSTAEQALAKTPPPELKPTAKAWDYVLEAMDRHLKKVLNPETGQIHPDDAVNKSNELVRDQLYAELTNPNRPWGKVAKEAFDMRADPRARMAAFAKAKVLFSETTSMESFNAQWQRLNYTERQSLQAGLAKEIRDNLLPVERGKLARPDMLDGLLTEKFKNKLRVAFGQKAEGLIRLLEAERDLMSSAADMLSYRLKKEESLTKDPNSPGKQFLQFVLAIAPAASGHLWWTMFHFAKGLAHGQANFASTPEGKAVIDETIRLLALHPAELDAVLSKEVGPQNVGKFRQLLDAIRKNEGAMDFIKNASSMAAGPSQRIKATGRLAGQSAATALNAKSATAFLGGGPPPSPDNNQKPPTGVAPTPAPPPPPSVSSASMPNADDLRGMARDVGLKQGLTSDQVDLFQRVIESGEHGFANPTGVSVKGARGVAQLMPDTAQQYGVKDVNDPRQNLEGAAKFFAHLMQKYGGDPVKVVAAYNAGEGAVDQYGGVPPFRETQAYVARVLGVGINPVYQIPNQDDTTADVRMTF